MQSAAVVLSQRCDDPSDPSRCQVTLVCFDVCPWCIGQHCDVDDSRPRQVREDAACGGGTISDGNTVASLNSCVCFDCRKCATSVTSSAPLPTFHGTVCSKGSGRWMKGFCNITVLAKTTHRKKKHSPHITPLGVFDVHARNAAVV